MRTYDDTFSGQRIYPGKVRFSSPIAAILSMGIFGAARGELKQERWVHGRWGGDAMTPTLPLWRLGGYR